MSSQPPLTEAEKAAAEALHRHFTENDSLGIQSINPDDFAGEARAVVAAVRPAIWGEAVAFLRSIADEDGVRAAADILDNAALSLPAPLRRPPMPEPKHLFREQDVLDLISLANGANHCDISARATVHVGEGAATVELASTLDIDCEQPSERFRVTVERVDGPTSPASMGGPLSEAERIAEIQARLDAASPGPWKALSYDDAPGDEGSAITAGTGMNQRAIAYSIPYPWHDQEATERDAELIAHAPDDLAHLLKRARLLEQAYEHAKEQRTKYERRVIEWREAAEAAAKERDEWRRVAADQTRMERDRAEETEKRVGVLEGQLATAQEQLAPFTAQHRPCKNMFRTCVTCRDGYGEPLPWPCRDAKRLGLATTCPACSDWVLRDGDANCPSCDADLTAKALGLDGGGPDE